MNDFEEAASFRKDQIRHIESVDDAINAIQASPSGSEVEAKDFVLRKITNKEHETLENECRCHASDWSKMYLLVPRSSSNMDDFSADLKVLVSNTRFDGYLVLDFSSHNNHAGDQDEEESEWSQRLPPGIHSNLLVADSVFRVKTCRVYQNSLISKSYIGSHAVVMNCGQITGPASNGIICEELSITVGAESGGGRELLLTPEATMMQVTRQIVMSAPPSGSKDCSSTSLIRYTIILDRAMVRNTSMVHNVFLYPSSSIEAAASVKNATLYPQATVSNASVVSNVLMQWNTSVTDNSKVNNVLMMEESHCGPSSIVESTVMGPDTHASAGEIHASVFGPNTNAHHQSLLIGALWPLGRGNVGYGANVGSNHTGRLPDQEVTVGEGIFWGLSCVIKFPVDLTWAPYSIIAAGTKLSPQRICMPFSLIMENEQGVNEIVPGWVLQSSPYTLARNSKKYATRRKAKRHSSYTGWKIFRSGIISMCQSAREILRNHPSGGGAPGIGANILTDRGSSVGMEAYTDCIQRYILEGLFQWMMTERPSSEDLERELNSKKEEKIMVAKEMFSDFKSVSWPSFPWDSGESLVNEWEYQRGLLLEEFPTDQVSELSTWLIDLLTKYTALENDFATRVAKAKARDDSRGASTIPGYAHFHVAANVDPVIIEVKEHAKEIEQKVKILITEIGN
jgi:hypothetical protein